MIVVEAEDLALGEGVRRVAVDAPQVAGGQPDKDARQPGERALALEAAIDLVDHQRPGRLPFERPEPVAIRRGDRHDRQARPGRSTRYGNGIVCTFFNQESGRHGPARDGVVCQHFDPSYGAASGSPRAGSHVANLLGSGRHLLDDLAEEGFHHLAHLILGGLLVRVDPQLSDDGHHSPLIGRVVGIERDLP